MAGLVASFDSAVVYIGGTRYPVPAASLTLADDTATLVVATPTGYAQVSPPAVPSPGTAAIISLIVTSGGSITENIDVRQYGGVTGKNVIPPSAFPGVSSVSIVPFAEGVGTIGVHIILTLSAPLDHTIQSAGFTYAVADSGKWHQFSAAVTDATNVQTFTGTIHGLDPDQVLDFAFQAVGVDGTPLPATPLPIGSIPAQSTPTPISKVIIPKGDPTYDETNPLQREVIQLRHFQFADADATPLFGDDTGHTFNHAVMSQGFQTLSDSAGNITGSSRFFSAMPNQVVSLADVSLQYATTSTSYAVWLTNLAASTTVDGSGHILTNPPQWIMADAAQTTFDMGTTTDGGYGASNAYFDSAHPIYFATGLSPGWKRWYIFTWTPTGPHTGTLTSAEFTTSEPTQAQKAAAFKDGSFLCICTVAGSQPAGIINPTSGNGGFNGGGGKVPQGL